MPNNSEDMNSVSCCIITYIFLVGAADHYPKGLQFVSSTLPLLLSMTIHDALCDCSSFPAYR